MDNRLFNVNGVNESHLELALQTLTYNEHGGNTEIKYYYYHPDHGIVLCIYECDDDKYKSKPFTDGFGNPIIPTIPELASILMKWLETEQSDEVPLGGWEGDIDHDGSNVVGWRLYTGEWGRIGNEWGSIAAFKKVYIWYGK